MLPLFRVVVKSFQFCFLENSVNILEFEDALYILNGIFYAFLWIALMVGCHLFKATAILHMQDQKSLLTILF